MEASPRYVRFAHPRHPLPRHGRSRNPLTGEVHAGVSCFPGELVRPDLFRIDTNPLTFPQGILSLLMHAAADSPAFFIWGSELDEVGTDGEPLVRVERCRPVPKSCAITAIEAFAQEALRRWSKGPRDASGQKFVRQRLTHGGYAPELNIRVSYGGGGNGKGDKKKKRKKKRAAPR